MPNLFEMLWPDAPAVIVDGNGDTWEGTTVHPSRNGEPMYYNINHDGYALTPTEIATERGCWT